MARGTQFSQLVYMLRAQIRRSTNVNVGVDDLPELKAAINSQYAQQWARFDWPFLDTYYPALQLNAGQRYYNLPGDLTYDRIKAVAVYFSGVPQRIERGITFEDYVLFDPDGGSAAGAFTGEFTQEFNSAATGAYSDPVLRWDIRAGTASQEQLEVWPVPSSNSQFLRFWGYKASPYLVNDSDQCWLDDLLVVLYAAAGLLALDESEPRVGLPPASQLKLKEADAYFAALTSNSAAARRTIALGQGRFFPKVDTNSLVRVRG